MDDITELRHEIYKRGFAVLPISGKRPPMDNWTEVVAGTELIKLWPKSYPFANNTGVLTKHTPAIDVDIENEEAAKAVEALARKHFEEHGMFAVRIGSPPRRAFLFRTDKPFRKQRRLLVNAHGAAGEKIEVLCDGQQIVVHGRHPDTHKPYAWFGGSPWAELSAKDLPLLTKAMALEFLRDAVELLTAEYGYKPHEEPKAKTNGGDGTARSASDWGYLFSCIYTGVDLHDAIARLAFSFVATGMSGGAAVARLRSMMETSQAPRDDRWRDRYDDVQRAVRTAQEKLEIAREERAKAEAEQPDQAREAEQPQQPPPKQPELPVASWHGETNPADSRPCLIDQLVPEVGAGLISGQWGSYKTFNALEIAHCVMTARPFLGFDIRRPGGVLFFALEGMSEISIRLQGVLDHKGSKRLERAPFAWHTSLPLRLTDPRAADVIIRMAEPVVARLKDEFNLPLSLIIIDTIVIGADYQREGQDNDVPTTHRMMMTMAKVARALGCFVFGVDHFGKDPSVGTRGSSVKEGDADVIFACLADKNEAGAVSNHRLALRKRRSGPNGEEFPFRTRVVEVGTNKFRQLETTLVLDYGIDPNAPLKPAKDDDWGKAKPVLHLRKVIMSLMAEHGVDIHPFPDGKPIRAVKVELVEAEFHRSYPVTRRGSEAERQIQDTKRRAFKRGLEDAVIKKGVIVTREIHRVDWVWLASRSPDEGAGPTENA